MADTENSIGSDTSDRFSKLPDELIYYILSFLFMRDISCMSATSRRCRTLCRSTPFIRFNLNYEAPSYLEARQLLFREYIDKLLAYRSQGVPIQDFELIARNTEDYNDLLRIEQWMHVLVRFNVQKLKLHINTNKSVVLPLPVLPCNSLEEQRISTGDQFLRLPSQQHFCFLEDLKLECLKLTDDFGARVSLCTALRSLEVRGCRGFNSFHVNSQGLVHICFVGCNGGHLDVKINATSLKNLHMGFPCSHNTTFDMCAPNLSSLTWIHRGACRWSLRKLTSLYKVNFRFTGAQNVKVAGRYESILQFFHAASCVKALTINDRCIQGLSEKDAHQPMILRNVEDLKMLTSLTDNDIPAISVLLKCLPNLKNISIVGYGTNLSSMSMFEDSFWESQNLEFLCQLRTVRIDPFRANGNDTGLVKYILKHACTMERMTLHCPRKLDLGTVFGGVHGFEMEASHRLISISRAV